MNSEFRLWESSEGRNHTHTPPTLPGWAVTCTGTWFLVALAFRRQGTWSISPQGRGFGWHRRTPEAVLSHKCRPAVLSAELSLL